MFKKYSSILNHYRSKEINWWLQEFPELLHAQYEIQEKIHGANIQLIFSPKEPFLVASRNRVLEEGEDFYGVKALLYQRFDGFTSCVKATARLTEAVITLYGEIFGPGIQKGVDYGSEKRIVFFDMAIDGEMESAEDTRNFFAAEGYLPLYIPQLAVVEGLNNALEFDTEIISAFGPNDPENIVEGVVIKPLLHTYTSHQGSRFLIKKKNERFKEKAKAKNPAPQVDSELERLHREFISYITDMRLQAVFSKHGEIDSPSEIGKYIKLVLTDAKEDFEQENELPELNKKELKYVYNVGSVIANMLKKYL